MNRTPYKDIYDIFLIKIMDFRFLSQSDEDIEDLCFMYLENAIPRFKHCRQDLSNRDPILREFNVKLTTEEKNILATFMVAEWLAPQINNIVLTKQFLSDSEYKHHSQANHLDKLLKLRDRTIEEGERGLILYSYTLEGIGDLK